MIVVIGGGTIGAGWGAAFATGGHDVMIIDPDPASDARLTEAWVPGARISPSGRTVWPKGPKPRAGFQTCPKTPVPIWCKRPCPRIWD